MRACYLLLPALALWLCAAGAAARRPSDLAAWSKPKFCKERDCPRFVKVESADGYETRRFEAAWWVWTEHQDVKDMQEAAMQAQAEILSYFMGSNKEGRMIQMGTPMAHNISFHPSKKAGEAADVGADTADAEGWAWGGLGKRKRRERLGLTVKMYLPYSFQDGKEEPPKPTSKHVHISKFPAWTAHVAGFEGWPTERKQAFHKAAGRLMDDLEEDGKDYIDEWAVCSIYNAPMETEGRWNEVLLSAETGKHEPH